MSKPIVALMYDFDKTLSPRNMQEYGFMEGLNVSAEEFWTECTKLTKVNGGHSIVVYQSDRAEAERLISENRANFAFKADYRKGSALEKTVKAIIDQISATETLKKLEGK